MDSDQILEVHNEDELRLAQMGHKQELVRHFEIWSLVGLASTLTISWTGLGLGLTTEINAGGPAGLLYGFILVTILQCFVGASLAEFVSAYPVEGGMYHWVMAVAPARYSAFLSFFTGYSTVFGWIFMSASTNLLWSSNFMALICLWHDNLVLQPWMTFAAYQTFNILTNAVPAFGNKLIPGLNRVSLVYLQVRFAAIGLAQRPLAHDSVQVAYFVIMTVVAAKGAPHANRSAEWVFKTWVNNTGWDNNVICFITGLVNPLYSLGGLDGVSHVSEELPNASRNAPLAIACTIGIAFVTGLTYLIALLFSVSDLDAIANTSTGLPLAELFRQATQSRGGGFILSFMLFAAVGPCLIASQLSMGRVFWSFSRDGGLPFSEVWRVVNQSTHTPVNAQIGCTAILAALGCIYLGSSTAFNAMMASSVTINNIAYLAPLLTSVCMKRKTLRPGAFHMGRWGMLVNIITILWILFSIVFFSFPYYMPVTPQNMNYTSVCIGGVLLSAVLWWYITGEHFSATMKRKANEKMVARIVLKEGGAA